MKPYWITLLSIGIFTLMILSPAEAVVRLQQPSQVTTVQDVEAQHRKLTRTEKRALRKEMRQARREMRRALRQANSEKKLDGFALLSFLLPITSLGFIWTLLPLSLIMLLAGIVLGIIGLVRIKRNPDRLRGKQVAWLGILMSMGIFLFIIVFILIVIGVTKLINSLFFWG